MSSIVEKVRLLGEKSVSLIEYVQSPLLLVVRLYWGYQFFLAGRGKLMNLDRTTEFFASINIPAPKINAIMAGSTECFGGLLLLIGLGARFTSIPLTITMVVAYLTAHREELMNIFTKPEDFLNAPPFMFLMSALIVLAFGPGFFSIDRLISKLLSSSSASETTEKKETVTELKKVTA